MIIGTSDIIVLGGAVLILFVLLRALGKVWRSRLLLFIVVGILGSAIVIGTAFLYQYWKAMNRQPFYNHTWQEDSMEDLDGNPISPEIFNGRYGSDVSADAVQ